MLIPREKPYLDGLNSYYLHLEKFVEHMQGEIGSGCLYFRGVNKELLVYFDEHEIVRSIVQERRHQCQISNSLDSLHDALRTGNFRVQVYHLGANAIFFWGQMPQFQRAKAALKSTEIPLPDLIFRLKQKYFSGFIDIELTKKKESALLFFHEGRRVGGSYSWGKGGLSTADSDYNTLLSKLQTDEGVFTFGSFIKEKKAGEESTGPGLQGAAGGEPPLQEPQKPVEPEKPKASLRPALEEFLYLYAQAMREASLKADPIVLLKERFLERVDEFPYLDPFVAAFEYNNGVFRFSDNAPETEIAAAIVACAWDVVWANRAERLFHRAVKGMRKKEAFVERNIALTS